MVQVLLYTWSVHHAILIISNKKGQIIFFEYRFFFKWQPIFTHSVVSRKYAVVADTY